MAVSEDPWAFRTERRCHRVEGRGDTSGKKNGKPGQNVSIYFPIRVAQFYQYARRIAATSILIGAQTCAVCSNSITRLPKKLSFHHNLSVLSKTANSLRTNGLRNQHTKRRNRLISVQQKERVSERASVSVFLRITPSSSVESLKCSVSHRFGFTLTPVSAQLREKAKGQEHCSRCGGRAGDSSSGQAEPGRLRYFDTAGYVGAGW